jgi:diamine N-acetyltransferase
MNSGTPHTIRRATLADAPALAELGAATFVEAFAYLYAPEDLADFLASSHSVAAYERHLRDSTVAV